MKIAIVFDNMIYGGIERVGISYIKLMKELGHEVDVYVLSKNIDGIMEEVRKCADNVYLHTFSRFLCPEFYWKLAEQKTWGKYVFPLVYLGLRCASPIVKIMKGTNIKYDIGIAFSGHTNDLTYVADSYVKASKKICWLHGAQYDYYIMSKGYVFLYRNIRNLVVLSNTCDYSCTSIVRNNNLNITKIYNPIIFVESQIDENKVSEIKARYGDYFLVVGRLANDKDPETVIRCMSLLKTKYGINNKLVFVGGGDKLLRLEKMSAELGLTDTVFFEGVKSDVQNYYSSAKLFIHSSPLEGLPTVLLEAMRFYLPIVATDSMPGVREILENNEYGMICPVGDENEMAKQIHIILNDSKLYEHYREVTQNRIKEFSPEVIKARICDLFESLI